MPIELLRILSEANIKAAKSTALQPLLWLAGLLVLAVVRSGINAYRDRRRRKRDFRALWITRLTAACRMRGISYSRFIFGLSACDIEINRKQLSELAISSPSDFDVLVELAKQHQPQSEAA